MNEFVSLVVQLDVNIVFCVINILPNLQNPYRKKKKKKRNQTQLFGRKMNGIIAKPEHLL